MINVVIGVDDDVGVDVGNAVDGAVVGGDDGSGGHTCNCVGDDDGLLYTGYG